MEYKFWNNTEYWIVTPLCDEGVCADILETTNCKDSNVNFLVMQILNWHLEYMKELKKRWAEELNKLD